MAAVSVKRSIVFVFFLHRNAVSKHLFISTHVPEYGVVGLTFLVLTLPLLFHQLWFYHAYPAENFAFFMV